MTRRHRGHNDESCEYCMEIAEAKANDEGDYSGRMADYAADYYERTYLDRDMS